MPRRKNKISDFQNGISDQIKYLAKKGLSSKFIRIKLKTLMPKHRVPNLKVMFVDLVRLLFEF
jgi:hypothetical protein